MFFFFFDFCSGIFVIGGVLFVLELRERGYFCFFVVSVVLVVCLVFWWFVFVFGREGERRRSFLVC